MSLTLHDVGIELDLSEFARVIANTRREGHPSLQALERDLARWRAELEERAAHRADEISDMLGIRDPLTRQINRLSWYIADLQDAGDCEDFWEPLVEEKLRLHRQWERLNRQ